MGNLTSNSISRSRPLYVIRLELNLTKLDNLILFEYKKSTKINETI